MSQVHIKYNDYKTKMWAAHSSSDVKIMGVEGSSLVVLKKYIKKNRKLPKAFVFRYLNDSKSIKKQIIVFIFDVILVAYLKINKVNVGWICHNVDKESSTAFPYTSTVKRWLLSRVSSRIFLTSPLLLNAFLEKFPDCKHKVMYATFGATEDHLAFEKSYKKSLEAISIPENLDNSFIYLLSVQTAHPKKISDVTFAFELAVVFEKFNLKCKVICAGSIIHLVKTKHPELYKKISAQKNMLFLDGYLDVEKFFSMKIRCALIKNYDDYSVPLALFHAVKAGIPIVTKKNTFIGSLVGHYKLGICINDFSKDCLVAICNLKKLDKRSAEHFFKDHDWAVGAAAISGLVK